MTLRTERCANRALAETNDTTLRFARSTAQAFAHERFNTVSHYVSQRLRHRVGRFVRNLIRWLLGPRP